MASPEPLLSSALLIAGSDEGKNFRFWPLRSFNHNNAVGFIRSTIEGVSLSVWGDTVITTYVYEIMGQSNTAAGVIDGISGICSMVVALPVGWIADKTRHKSRLIALGGLLTPIAAAATSFAVIYGVMQLDDSPKNATETAASNHTHSRPNSPSNASSIEHGIAGAPPQLSARARTPLLNKHRSMPTANARAEI